jgi:hypothetical protein
VIEVRGGQNVLRCGRCGRFAYNVPKLETGQQPASLTDRLGVTPSARARIFRAWDHRCAWCGVPAHEAEGGLHLGHLVGRELAERFGLLDALIDHPVNLAPECARCNLGARMLGPLPLRLLVRAMLITVRYREHGGR